MVVRLVTFQAFLLIPYLFRNIFFINKFTFLLNFLLWYALLIQFSFVVAAYGLHERHLVLHLLIMMTGGMLRIHS
jgi:hypothetical protein